MLRCSLTLLALKDSMGYMCSEQCDCSQGHALFAGLIDPGPAVCSNSSCEVANTTALNCTAGFVFDPSVGICSPLCGWSPHLQQLSSSSRDVIGTLSYLMLMLFSGVNLILSFTIQRRSM